MTDEEKRGLEALHWVIREQDLDAKWELKLVLALKLGIKARPVIHKINLWDGIEETVDRMSEAEIRDALNNRETVETTAMKILLLCNHE
jgi:hypothetical protein